MIWIQSILLSLTIIELTFGLGYLCDWLDDREPDGKIVWLRYE